MDRLLLESLDPTVRIVALHVLRCLALLYMLPYFTSGTMGRFHRFVLAILLGTTAATMRGIDLSEDPGGEVVPMLTAGAREVALGALLGWIINLLFDVLRIAGSLIATEMGLNLAQQVDPISNSQQTIIASLLVYAGYVLFFAMDAHVRVLEAIVESFRLVPPGQFAVGGDLAEHLIEFTVWVFLTGLRMAAPVYFILLIVTITVGFLAKVAPQLNVLEASWPIRILSAMILLILFVEPVVSAFQFAVDGMAANLMQVLEAVR